MSKRPPAPKRFDHPAMVLSSANGEVIQQNQAAMDLLGDGVGLDCWQLVGVPSRGDRVPCEAGCAGRLVEAGCDAAQTHPVLLGKKRYQLSCAPVGGYTVTTLAALDPPRVDQDGRSLSAREIEVLELMARGFTVSGISQELTIGERTVRTHIEHMRSKLNVSSQAALVAQGYERGYLG
jgi:DNA-binding CsgD family transcriptional regulator